MRALRSVRGFGWAVPTTLGLLVAAAIASGKVSETSSRNLVLIAVYALVVAGFNVSFGYGGQLALGQVAVFAAGAYSAAILHQHGVDDLLVAVAVGMLAAAVLGVVSGLPGIRLSEFALAITAFFLVLLVPNAVLIFDRYTNGTVGISGILRPSLAGMSLTPRGFNATAVAMAALVLLLCRNLVVGRYGNTLLQLKTSATLTRSLGLSPVRLRISSYVLGSLPAGAAGALFAYQSTYIEPNMFNFGLVTLMLAASVVGGVKSVWGAVVGAALLVLGPDQLASFDRYSVLVYGLFLVAAGVGFSQGIAGLAGATLERLAPLPSPSEGLGTDDTELAIHGEVLVVRDVAKRFGGVHALRSAHLEAAPGQVTAVIGANGAGKTTLLNVVSGFVRPDGGSVTLGARALTGASPTSIARSGVARTFQTPLVPEGLSVIDVVASGRAALNRIGPVAVALRTRRLRRVQAEDREMAALALRFAGLDHLADHRASELPLGSRRLLEVARCLAAEPRLLLLDEPAAGLDESALQQLAQVIRRARDAGSTVVLVEHNVNFVMDLADRVAVMDLGESIAVGAPEEILRNEEVIARYLGTRSASNPSNEIRGPRERV